MRQLEDEYLRDLPYLVDAMPTYLGICKPYRLTRDNIRRVPYRGIASPAPPREVERVEHYRDIYCGLHLSLRFKHEEFCDGEKPIAKLSRSPFSSAQALLLRAG